jgi:sugar phosphate isomerase/epimerase
VSGDSGSGQRYAGPTPWPLAVYSVVLPRLTPEAAVDAAKSAGYVGIFWRARASSGPTALPIHVDGEHRCLLDPTAEAMAEARRLGERAGVRSAGLALGSESYAVDRPGVVERALDLAERLGAEQLRLVGGSAGDGQSYSAAYEATVRRCEAYVKAARGRAVRVVLQQHYGTAVPSASLLLRVLEQFDPKEIGCIYDPGNMTVEGYEEYRIGLEMLGDYVTDIHVKNSRYFGSGSGGVWEREWSPLHDGLIDLLRLFRALHRTSYRGWVTMSDFSPSRDEGRMLRHNRQVIFQSMRGDEGVFSHTPYRPLDDHVARVGR